MFKTTKHKTYTIHTQFKTDYRQTQAVQKVFRATWRIRTRKGKEKKVCRGSNRRPISIFPSLVHNWSTKTFSWYRTRHRFSRPFHLCSLPNASLFITTEGIREKKDAKVKGLSWIESKTLRFPLRFPFLIPIIGPRRPSPRPENDRGVRFVCFQFFFFPW